MRWLVVPLCALLASCSWLDTIIPQPVLETGTTVAVPQPQPIKTTPVRWQVLNTDALKALVAKLEAKPDANYVIYVLDTKNFAALTLNLTEMKRYIQEQKEAIRFAVTVLDTNAKHNTQLPPLPKNSEKRQ